LEAAPPFLGLGGRKEGFKEAKRKRQQCGTPAVIPGAAPPRPRLGRGRRITLIIIMKGNFTGVGLIFFLKIKKGRLDIKNIFYNIIINIIFF
jgi:hypothetical protein